MSPDAEEQGSGAAGDLKVWGMWQVCCVEEVSVNVDMVCLCGQSIGSAEGRCVVPGVSSSFPGVSLSLNSFLVFLTPHLPRLSNF
jgi:hypothetical protein